MSFVMFLYNNFKSRMKQTHEWTFVGNPFQYDNNHTLIIRKINPYYMEALSRASFHALR